MAIIAIGIVPSLLRQFHAGWFRDQAVVFNYVDSFLFRFGGEVVENAFPVSPARRFVPQYPQINQENEHARTYENTEIATEKGKTALKRRLDSRVRGNDGGGA